MIVIFLIYSSPGKGDRKIKNIVILCLSYRFAMDCGELTVKRNVSALHNHIE